MESKKCLFIYYLLYSYTLEDHSLKTNIIKIKHQHIDAIQDSPLNDVDKDLSKQSAESFSD